MAPWPGYPKATPRTAPDATVSRIGCLALAHVKRESQAAWQSALALVSPRPTIGSSSTETGAKMGSARAGPRKAFVLLRFSAAGHRIAWRLCPTPKPLVPNRSLDLLSSALVRPCGRWSRNRDNRTNREGNDHGVDHPDSHRNLHRPRDQRLPAGRVLIRTSTLRDLP